MCSFDLCKVRGKVLAWNSRFPDTRHHACIMSITKCWVIMKWVKNPKNSKFAPMLTAVTVEGESLLLNGKFLCKKERWILTPLGLAQEAMWAISRKPSGVFFYIVPTLVIISSFFFFSLFFPSVCFMAAPRSMWDLNSLTSHGTRALCNGNAEFYTMDHQGIPQPSDFSLSHPPAGKTGRNRKEIWPTCGATYAHLHWEEMER